MMHLPSFIPVIACVCLIIVQSLQTAACMLLLLLIECGLNESRHTYDNKPQVAYAYAYATPQDVPLTEHSVHNRLTVATMIIVRLFKAA
jgi:hypothetical protein